MKFMGVFALCYISENLAQCMDNLWFRFNMVITKMEYEFTIVLLVSTRAVTAAVYTENLQCVFVQ